MSDMGLSLHYFKLSSCCLGSGNITGALGLPDLHLPAARQEQYTQANGPVR